ncbi:MAG: anthranilate phosphoribosyltransferase [Bacteroidales bacterium]|nr:anthranilate phosphoribosyltransferase [Bacteroidales bacterium]
MKQFLTRLVEGETLSAKETEDILIGITEGRFPQEQITAFIMSLQMRGVAVDELIGLRNGILNTGVPAEVTDYKPIDIVGTGGDGKNTFNISTCACFVVAGAGYKVAKHGNYAATSVSGASDVIEGHGVKFTADKDKLRRSMDECGIVYLHAPLFARAMKFVAPIRKALKIPTCFNLLGPLVNPARPAYQLLGVANLNQMRLYSNVYQQLGINYGIVSSTDGYDEISLTSPFKIITRSIEKIFSPQDFGMKTATARDLSGEDGQTKADAVAVFDRVLQNKATESQIDVVVVNAAAAIKIIEKDKDIKECINIARESILSGRAFDTLKKFVALNS